jgi:hypothetical protein
MHSWYLLCTCACNRCDGGSHLSRVQGWSTGGTLGSPAAGDPEEGEPDTDHLPECPDHQPSTFVKGKPQSIINLPTL